MTAMDPIENNKNAEIKDTAQIRDDIPALGAVMDQSPLQINVRFPFAMTDNFTVNGAPFLTEASDRKNCCRAMIREIDENYEDCKDYRITQVNLTGGSVCMTDPTSWQLVLRELKKTCDLKPAEITMKITPGSFTRDDYYRFTTEGGDWLIVEMVSDQAPELEICRMTHRPIDNTHLFLLLSGFQCRSFDLRLYYGIPGQTEASLKKSLDKAVHMFGNHISLLPWKDAAPEAEALYAAGKAFLLGFGFEEYIRGHFGKNGARIRLYTETVTDYMGIGPAADSRMDGLHFCNIDDIGLYIQYSDRPDLICRRIDD